MTAKYPSWTKRLGDRIKSMRRHDPQFAAEYQAEIDAHRPSLFERVFTMLAACIGIAAVLVLIPAGLAHRLESERHIDRVVAIVGFLSTLAAFGFAEVILTRSHKSNELSVCSHLPTEDKSIIRCIWNRTLLYTLIGLWYLLAIDYGVLSVLPNTTTRIALTVAFAIVQWGFVVGLGTWLAGRIPGFPYGKAATLMAFAGIGGVFFGNNQIHHLLMWTGWVSPGGWVPDAMWLGVLKGKQTAFLAALPALLVALFVPIILRNLAEYFRIKEFLIRQGQELRAIFSGRFSGAEASRMVRWIGSGEEPPESSEESVRDHWENLDDSGGWTKRGWQERLVARWLTPRERHLVTFLTGDVTYWSSSWNTAVRIILILVFFVASGLWTFHWNAVFAIVYFAGIFLLVSVLQDSHPGLYMTRCSGSYVAHFANYPLGTGELTRIFLKLCFFRACFVGIYCLPLIALLGWVNLRYGYTAAVYYVIGMMSLAFWRLSYFLSGGYSMPRLRWSTLWIPAVLIGLMFVTGFSAIFGVLNPSNLFPGLVFWAASSIAVWWFFKRLVDRGRTDLVSANESVLGNQQWDNLLKAQKNMEDSFRKQKELRQQYGTFWWLRRPFG